MTPEEKRERDRAKQQRWRERPGNREKERERVKRWRAANPDKVREGMKRWREANRDQERKINRRSKLRKAYGIEVEEFNRMHAEQDGRCAICETAAALVVDHCHTTHSIRALLCSPCNVGLGMFGDDPARMRAAARYIEDAQKE